MSQLPLVKTPKSYACLFVFFIVLLFLFLLLLLVFFFVEKAMQLWNFFKLHFYAIFPLCVAKICDFYWQVKKCKNFEKKEKCDQVQFLAAMPAGSWDILFLFLFWPYQKKRCYNGCSLKHAVFESVLLAFIKRGDVTYRGTNRTIHKKVPLFWKKMWDECISLWMMKWTFNMTVYKPLAGAISVRNWIKLVCSNMGLWVRSEMP